MQQLAILDDDSVCRKILEQMAEQTQMKPISFSNGKTFLEHFQTSEKTGVGAMILDMYLPDGTGLEFLDQVQKENPDVPVIMISARRSEELKAAAAKRGVKYFLQKPLDIRKTVSAIESVLSIRKNISPTIQIATSIVGRSSAVMKLRDLIALSANTSANVLIEGESGTGKELAARAIHNLSARSEGPFVAVNCGAIPDALFESEFFGHAKGSFTGAYVNHQGLFEKANNGTLFLDEVGELPLTSQVKLLRVIQERMIRPVGSTIQKPINIRIIAATNQNLRQGVINRTFRTDLYYRLNVISLKIPSLRERSDDIPDLANSFLRKFNRKYDLHCTCITPEALGCLQKYSWPGNIRELENILERAVVLKRTGPLDTSAFELSDTHESYNLYSGTLSLEQLEMAYIRFILEKYGDHQEKAAQVLGIDRKTLFRKRQNSLSQALKLNFNNLNQADNSALA